MRSHLFMYAEVTRTSNIQFNCYFHFVENWLKTAVSACSLGCGAWKMLCIYCMGPLWGMQYVSLMFWVFWVSQHWSSLLLLVCSSSQSFSAGSSREGLWRVKRRLCICHLGLYRGVPYITLMSGVSHISRHWPFLQPHLCSSSRSLSM